MELGVPKALSAAGMELGELLEEVLCVSCAGGAALQGPPVLLPQRCCREPAGWKIGPQD